MYIHYLEASDCLYRHKRITEANKHVFILIGGDFVFLASTEDNNEPVLQIKEDTNRSEQDRLLLRWTNVIEFIQVISIFLNAFLLSISSDFIQFYAVKKVISTCIDNSLLTDWNQYSIFDDKKNKIREVLSNETSAFEIDLFIQFHLEFFKTYVFIMQILDTFENK